MVERQGTPLASRVAICHVVSPVVVPDRCDYLQQARDYAAKVTGNIGARMNDNAEGGIRRRTGLQRVLPACSQTHTNQVESCTVQYNAYF